MKPATLFLFGFLLASDALVAESFSTESPDKTVTVVFDRESDRHIYSVDVRRGSIRRQLFKDAALAINNKSMLWSRDSRFLAFSAGTPFLMEGYLLSLDEPPELIRLPGPELGWDNFHITPRKWSGKKLFVTVTGPHAGKADGYFFSGTIVYEISEQSTKVRIVRESINIEEQK